MINLLHVAHAVPAVNNRTIDSRRILSALHAELSFAICRQRSLHASVKTIGRTRLCGCNGAYAVYRRMDHSKYSQYLSALSSILAGVCA